VAETRDSDTAAKLGAATESQPLDLLILGPIPPPYGGVSNHLDRLVPLLERAGLTVGVLNHFASMDRPYVLGTLRRNPLRYLVLPRRFKSRIVHYHHARLVHLLAVALGRPNRKVHYVVTLHGRGILKHLPPRTTRMGLVPRNTLWALSRFDSLIAVNAEVATRLREHLPGRHVEVIPAFVEPGDGPVEPTVYEQPLETFLSSGPTVVAAAYGVQFLDDGREVYGLDLTVEAFAELGAALDDLRLVLFIARHPKRSRARRHLAKLDETLAAAGLSNRCSIVYGQPLLPALRKNVVFVRPSRADGDAVSIREALQAAVPVVASDVVERPPGTVLFPTDDGQAFTSALRSALDSVAANDRAVMAEKRPPSGDSFSDSLIRLYRLALGAEEKGAARVA
jgi:glycosyltransferase involved in cell wall biosynthesis